MLTKQRDHFVVRPARRFSTFGHALARPSEIVGCTDLPNTEEFHTPEAAEQP